jgi:thymidylate synthase (FAD)
VKIVNPSFEIITPKESFLNASKILEIAGRVCYKSEGMICPGSDTKFLTKLLSLEHESVIEHFSVTVKFVCDRGVTHELVRHRIASFSQESTRYCNYTKDKFDGHISLIHPKGLSPYQIIRREEHFWKVQEIYDREISEGVRPEIARGLLPNALKTEIVVTANLREWRHIFKLRASPKAHPQIRELMIPLRLEFQKLVPVIFNNLIEELSIIDRYLLIPPDNKTFIEQDMDVCPEEFHAACDLIGVPRKKSQIYEGRC